MECRDIRPLIGSFSTMDGRERQLVAAHLERCAACRDEAEDVSVAPVFSSVLPMVPPPPELTQKILARLPAASPMEIARAERRTRQIYRTGGALVAGSFGLLALGGLILLDLAAGHAVDLLPAAGLSAALVAKALLIAAGQPWPVVLALASAAIALLFVRSSSGVRLPSGVRLSSGALVGATAALTTIILLNATAVRPDTGSLGAPIDVERFVAGDVTSLAGDLTIRGEVAGDVVSLLGRVSLEPGAHVRGSVMSGVGNVREAGGVVDQAIIDPAVTLPAFARVTGTGATTEQGDADLGHVAGLLAALLALTLGTLLAIVWPQGLRQASFFLARYPGEAVTRGATATLGLAFLAISGMVLLAASVAGIVLVPILLLLVHMPNVVGIGVVGQLLGTRLSGSPTMAAALWGIGAQIVLVIGLSLLAPAAGLGVFYLAGSAGLGALLLDRRRDLPGAEI